MTKYVLNSGGLRKQPKLKQKFHQEIIKGIDGNPKFLLCNFAQGREYWEVKFPGYTDSINNDMPAGVHPTFTLAMPESFADQCLAADIIYFHGGDDYLVQFWMKQFDLKELFKDKVIATNSATSNMLATHYWTGDWRRCDDGLGVLPIKFFAHYQSEYGDDDTRGPIDWKKAYDELTNYGDKTLPIHALKEGEFVVIEQNYIL